MSLGRVCDRRRIGTKTSPLGCTISDTVTAGIAGIPWGWLVVGETVGRTGRLLDEGILVSEPHADPFAHPEALVECDELRVAAGVDHVRAVEE